ncbi:probable multidrug resistance-associated protein lethal(2)03659 isoform X2 [Cylas formicarius]|uniref:probable multidrug resistance-associated protein lethal(2)03659 isoform X2 n=1 Tax=Cylas formicarius TaxID=197179 RepID=UPI002958AB1A|nr:probable multidrug resistance-associated protein lethal(2)03659 isoform X2 [Cylas formicarius]
MDAAFELKLENPRRKANIISKLFFAWVVKLYYTGTRRELKLDDLYKTLDCDESQYLGNKLELHWNEEAKRAKEKGTRPSLLRALSNTFFWHYMKYGALVFISNILLRSPQPLVLSQVITQFQPGVTRDRTWMYASSGTLIAISGIMIFFMHHTNYGQSCEGMRVRIAVSSLIYRKIMRLNKRSQGQTAAGQVINLLSNDVQRFDFVAVFLHYLWIMPFQVILVSYFIWQEVGISSLAGILSMALCTLPVQAYLSKLTSTLRLKVAQRTDQRVKLMSEIISGIQVIKMYAWEKPLEQIIKYLRAREIKVLTSASYVRGFMLSCMVFIERSTLFLTVVCYVLLGHNITADKVFSMAQFFNILQAAMAIFFPMAISLGAEAWVSVKRLEDVLVLDEKQVSVVEELPENEIRVSNVTASWVPGTPVLKNFNLLVPKGSLCAVIGPVGAGKSSLLQLLLGEISPESGKVQLGGTVSYSSQEPWLFASSVRKNILFGKPYDATLYKKVADRCALEKDFEQFPHGDKTLVGERGVSLSGGQRARINLARAIYRDADVILLDDPLSAVDTHVGKHLFDKCIVRYLRGRTRVLVTHQLQYLKKADIIVVLKEGRIEAMGTFNELLSSDLDFTKLLAAADESHDEKGKLSRENSMEGIRSRKASIRSLSESSIDQTIKDENQETGVYEGGSLKEYFKAVGNEFFVVAMFFVLILAQAICTGADYWVAYWTNQEEIRHLNDSKPIVGQIPLEQVEVFNLSDVRMPDLTHYTYVERQPMERSVFDSSDLFDRVESNGQTQILFKTNIAIYIYACLIIGAVVVTIARSFCFYKVAMLASKHIHSKMFHCLLKTPMRFFDINPSGRVLNRFSKDMGAIDEALPRVLIDAIQIILVMAGILINVTISNYYMVIAMILLGAIFLKIRSWYVASAKDIKHLEGIAKSPVFSHVTSSLAGLTTIRASQLESTLIKEFDEHQNVHTSAWFLTIMCTVSFGLWLDIICVIFVACVTFGFVVSADYNLLDQNGSLVGLAISQSLILTGMLQYGMRQTADVVNQLTSVERVMQYTKLDTEGPFETPKENLPEKPWPGKGRIEFRDLSLNYASGEPPVLKKLNFKIEPGEKVGIVGRTGAGKSSLISALFRLAPLEGQILIDDIDTQTVGLNDLRKKISIIPQEPVLFSATLRYNLDPFDEFQDSKLWEVLEEVELKDLVDSLNFQVSEGGSNFSLGQRQLLCLARALLRNNKILVLDEATANVDAKTDGLIQSTIRKKFKDCTVLTIAHRLNTIMDSDKVLVMGFGQLLEFDHPHTLLQVPNGHFHKMVLETGKTMTHHLKDIARNSWELKEDYIPEENFDTKL